MQPEAVQSHRYLTRVNEISRRPSWNSGLPEGWSAGETSEGRVFFINHTAQTTSWNHPISGRRFGGKGSSRRGKGGGGGGARGVIGGGGGGRGGGGGGGDISSLSSLSRETSSPGGGGRGDFFSPTQGWEVSASASPPEHDHTSLSPPSFSRGLDAGEGDHGRSVVFGSSSVGIGVGADVDDSTRPIYHPGSGERRDQNREHPLSSAVSPSGTEASGWDQVLLGLVEGRQLGRPPLNTEHPINPGSPLPDSDALLREKVLPYLQKPPPSTSSLLTIIPSSRRCNSHT